MNSADDSTSEHDPRLLLPAGMAFYVLLTAAAVVWLWWRDRLGALPEQAIGGRGMWAGAGVGLAIGWIGSRGLSVYCRRVEKLRDFELMIRRSFAAAGDNALILFVLAGAIAEELFFRLAVWDALGLWGAVALSITLNSCIAGWVWLPVAVAQALSLGLLMQFGFGLLGATTANAMMNYFHLRRIQCS